MRNLLQKFKYSIQADLYHFFDKKSNKNPIPLLNQYIREAEKKTEETAKLLARQAQLKKELEQKLQEVDAMLTKRTEQLTLAQNTTEQELITFATEEVAAYTARKEALVASIEASTAHYMQLERKFETMKHKIQDMKVRQLQLMGKENALRAHHQMDHVLTANGVDNFAELTTYIDELGQKIDRKYEVTAFETRLLELEQQQKHDHQVQ